MNDLERRCLDAFPEWLRGLSTDAVDLARILGSASIPEAAKRNVTASLNYLFKSLDLIPDGIEDIGYLDDAFVIRVAAALSLREFPDLRTEVPLLARLADDTALVTELLERDYARLEAYVKTLPKITARGRTVDEVLRDDATRAVFHEEVAAWASAYTTPTFARDEKNLVKLRSFLGAKLPT